MPLWYDLSDPARRTPPGGPRPAPSYVLMVLTALFVATKVRERDFRSVPDIVDAHYGRAARVMVAAANFVYALPAFSIMGLGGLFHLLFGFSFKAGMPLGSAGNLAYTALGGLLAVAVTGALLVVYGLTRGRSSHLHHLCRRCHQITRVQRAARRRRLASTPRTLGRPEI